MSGQKETRVRVERCLYKGALGYYVRTKRDYKHITRGPFPNLDDARLELVQVDKLRKSFPYICISYWPGKNCILRKPWRARLGRKRIHDLGSFPTWDDAWDAAIKFKEKGLEENILTHHINGE